MSDIAKSLTKAVIAAEERAGTMPAKEAVKLRPSDWHTLCKTAREAADEITRLRQLLSEAEKREKAARRSALEEADQICAKALSEGSPIHPIALKYITGIRNALIALQSEER